MKGLIINSTAQVRNVQIGHDANGVDTALIDDRTYRTATVATLGTKAVYCYNEQGQL